MTVPAAIEHAYWCAATVGRDCNCHPLVRRTEVDGISVGDDVIVHNRWPATVIGFLSQRCDVQVRWTGKRPNFAHTESTICRREVGVKLARPRGAA